MISAALNEFGGSYALGWALVAAGGCCFIYAALLLQPVQDRIPWTIARKQKQDPKQYVAWYLSQLIWDGSTIPLEKDDGTMARRYQVFSDNTVSFLRIAFNALEATRFQGVAQIANLKEFNRAQMARDSLARLEAIADRFSAGELEVSPHFVPARWAQAKRNMDAIRGLGRSPRA